MSHFHRQDQKKKAKMIKTLPERQVSDCISAGVVRHKPQLMNTMDSTVICVTQTIPSGRAARAALEVMAGLGN